MFKTFLNSNSSKSIPCDYAVNDFFFQEKRKQQNNQKLVHHKNFNYFFLQTK